MRYYKNEYGKKRQLLKIFTPQKWEAHVANFRPKNVFQVKFQTISWGKFPFGFPAICNFLLSFQKLLRWGGGGGGISAFYSVKLCIIKTRIHNTLLHRGSCDLTPIFLFQMFGTCDNAFACLTSFSLPTLLLSVESHSFLFSIFPIVSIELCLLVKS